MSVKCQVNVKSQSELDIGGRETCYFLRQKYLPNTCTFVQSFFLLLDIIFFSAVLKMLRGRSRGQAQAGIMTSEVRN